MRIEKNKYLQDLHLFLNFPISSSEPVLEIFANLPGAVECSDGSKRNYVFVPGWREDRVVLCAHADTVWDIAYNEEKYDNTVVYTGEKFKGLSSKCGIGADDRAGCAMLWALKDSGHSLLVLNFEEHGQVGARLLKENNKRLFDIINNHSYIIELDRQGGNEFKTYNIPVSDNFVKFIQKETGYHRVDNFSRTDICVLCERICGANLSLGYYNEHTPNEILVADEWLHTLEVVKKLISAPQKRFPTIPRIQG